MALRDPMDARKDAAAALSCGLRLEPRLLAGSMRILPDGHPQSSSGIYATESSTERLGPDSSETTAARELPTKAAQGPSWRRRKVRFKRTTSPPRNLC